MAVHSPRQTGPLPADSSINVQTTFSLHHTPLRLSPSTVLIIITHGTKSEGICVQAETKSDKSGGRCIVPVARGRLMNLLKMHASPFVFERAEAAPRPTTSFEDEA